MTEEKKLLVEEVSRKRKLNERVRMETVGRRIKLARASNNLTQKQFADEIGISRNYLSVLESGKGNPSFDVMMSLQKFVPDITDLTKHEMLEPEHEVNIFESDNKGLSGHFQSMYKEQENNVMYMTGLIKRLYEDERREVEEFIFALLKKRKE